MDGWMGVGGLQDAVQRLRNCSGEGALWRCSRANSTVRDKPDGKPTRKLPIGEVIEEVESMVGTYGLFGKQSRSGLLVAAPQ